MSQYLALLACIVFVAWLYVRDRDLRPMTSGGLWIPLLWVMLIGTRTSSYWLDFEVDPDQIYASSLEGSPLDRNVFLALIIAGGLALFGRRVNWGELFASNRWLFFFFLYCGVSVIWSDYPFPSLKKYTKDLGNLVMILIILTESKPVTAVKAVFARYIYLAIPLSVVLIYFFPSLGTYIQNSSNTILYCGVTTNKNELGSILAISGVFLVWDLLGRREVGRTKIDLVLRSLLLAMVIWLLVIVDSATSRICLAIGITILLCDRLPFIRGQVRHLGVYSLVIISLTVFLFSYPAITEAFFRFVGRDITFTGRTDIWQGLLKEPINPLVGTGFQSFWLRPGLVERMDRFDHINEAHNGYLEIYLNGGLLGLGLLLAMIVSVWSKLKRGVMNESSMATLFFAFLVMVGFYNLTEAGFSRLGLTWFVFLLAALGYPLPDLKGASLEAKPGGVRVASSLLQFKG